MNTRDDKLKGMVATEKQTGHRHSHQLNDLTAIYSLIYLVDSVKAQAQSLHGTHAVQLRRTWRAFGPLQQRDNWPAIKHEWRDSVGTQRGGHSALSDLRARYRKVWVEHGWNNNGGRGGRGINNPPEVPSQLFSHGYADELRFYVPRDTNVSDTFFPADLLLWY